MSTSDLHDEGRINEDIDEKLYGLVDIAEQQQATAHLILEQLSNERLALAHERDRWTQALSEISGGIQTTLIDALSSSMAGIGTTVSATFSTLSQPAAERIAQAAESADRADQALRRLVGWAGARILLWGLAALSGLVLLGWLASGIVLWWDTKAIATAHVEKLQLQMEVAELRANRDVWTDVGMATQLRQCGRNKKACIAVDETAGKFGKNSDYRIIKPG